MRTLRDRRSRPLARLPGRRVVAVTGAAGRIGQACLAALADSGAQVIAIDCRGGHGPGDWRRADLRDEAAARRSLAGATHLIHLAARTAPDDADAIGVLVDNVTVAANVLEAFAAGSPRVAVVASSIAVYGTIWGDRVLSPYYAPIDEDHPCLAQDTYSVSKLATEQLCAMWTRRSGMSGVALRFPWTAGDEPDRVGAHVAEMRADPGADLGRRHLWSYVHADDVADAAVQALDVADGEFHVLNIAAADLLVDESAMDLMARFHPATELRPGLADLGPWSTRRARDLLDWRPQRTVAPG